ncbi:DUF4192 domain-containing protein [Actinokineospora auranticolor]|uniref:Uncharacterized protein DUF4192 n=1 Tax=Actinokineospora auranticolor TaxID=155976 RepID=A0A2S6GCK0_9PSEU|nr:DUF4192 domain-containing protein [Actinokineospora auranticolor]PPK62204.1 uncharacterized protein DUF4192 [Actinokineospora auranticolor]
MTTNLHQAADLIAAIPYLLGYHPDNSVIALTLRGPGPVPSLGPVIRADLPAPPDYEAGAAHLAMVAVEHDVGAAILVVVGRGGEPLPHREFADMARAELAASGITVPRALWTASVKAGEPWRCYDDLDGGVVPDPDCSEIAAQYTVAGVVKYPSRQAMADTLAPDPAADLERRAEMIDQLLSEELDDPTSDEDLFSHVESAVDAFHETAVSSTLDGLSRGARSQAPHSPDYREPGLSDERIARLALALGREGVRDRCLAFAMTAKDAAAARLWTRMVRAVPEPERAEPACLLAVSAYLAGNGILAHIALEISSTAQPGHVLSSLLVSAAHHGMPPDDLRTLIEGVVVNLDDVRTEGSLRRGDPPIPCELPREVITAPVIRRLARQRPVT